MSEWDVVVIGGGPAGLSAALMLGRSRRRVIVVDAGNPRNRFASHMHGVLGNEGVNPADLIERGRRELEGYGAVVVSGTVIDVENQGEELIAVTDDGERLRARSVVVATGLSDQLPDIPGLAQHWGVSVVHCPYCHGWEVRDQRLGVLATSAMALHQVQLVRQLSDSVALFTNGADLLDTAAQNRLAARGVRVVTEGIREVLGRDMSVTGVQLDSDQVVAVDALFTVGGLVPHDGFLAGLNLAKNETPMGRFLAVDQMGTTSHPRVWAVGNVVEHYANVPMSIGAGSFVGASVNAALTSEDFDRAEAAGQQ